MSTEVKRRRGTETEHEIFTGGNAELTVNTTDNSIHVHDAITPGGHKIINQLASIARSLNIQKENVMYGTVGASIGANVTHIYVGEQQTTYGKPADVPDGAVIVSIVDNGLLVQGGATYLLDALSVKIKSSASISSMSFSVGQLVSASTYYDDGEDVKGLNYRIVTDNPGYLGTVNHQSANGYYAKLIVGNSILIEQAGGVDDCVISTRAGTDNTSAIEDADSFAVSEGVSFVDFKNGAYLAATAAAVTKSPFTTWRAPRGSDLASSGTLENRLMGGAIYSQNDTACVHIVSPNFGSNVFAGYVAQFDGLDLVGDYTNYPNATGYIVDPLIKQLAFKWHWVRGYNAANNLKFAGEFFYLFCNYQFNKYAMNAENSSDFWVTNCHMGSGKSSIGSDFSGGAGLDLFGCGNWIFSGSRPQVQEGGNGGFLNLCSNISFNTTTVDQNENNGLVLQNCRETIINGSRIFGNGIVGGNSGITLGSYRQIATPDFSTNTLSHSSNFTGKFIKTKVASTGTLPSGLNDSSYYWTRYLAFDTTALYVSFQDARDDVNRVEFTDNGTGTFYFVLGCQGTNITANNFEDRGEGFQTSGVKLIGDTYSECVNTIVGSNVWPTMTTPVSVDSGVVGEEFRRVNNVGDAETVNLFAMSVNYNLYPYTEDRLIYVNGAFTANRDVIVSKSGAWLGWTCKVARVTTAAGDANTLSIKDEGGTTLATVNNNESATIVYAGGELSVIK